MSERIYYVGIDLNLSSSTLLSSLTHQERHFHCTLMYSKIWFPYKQKRHLTITLTSFKIEKLSDGNIPVKVLLCEHPILHERHNELKQLGAIHSYEVFKPHITLGPYDYTPDLYPPCLVLNGEYYGTWENTR
jgi:hypothetical protein